MADECHWSRSTGQKEDSLRKDDSQFEALALRQSRFVFRVAYALLRNAHDAEDVVQETFLKLYRTEAWKNIQDERAFLARMAWRIALDAMPPSSRQSETEIDLPSPRLSPEEQAADADWQQYLHKMIDSLPEELRQPLALSALQELNSREIASVLGIAEGTVRTRIMRARQILKQKIAPLTEKRYAR